MPEEQREKLLRMSVGNTGFLLDRLGQDCHRLQFLRELTQNAIEAIQRAGGKGSIVWDVDWNTYELGKTYKLCITDTGDGMTGSDMIAFINRLSSSAGPQSFAGNYGVGAKIASVPLNPLGVIYLSWKDGDGAMVHLCRDPDSGQYGLKQWARSDGTFSHWIPIEEDVKPETIKRHGTRVILLGRQPEDNTMQAPPASPSPSRWIAKYLNSRYFLFPEGVTIKAREGWRFPRSDRARNKLRTLTGQKAYLDHQADQSGCLELPGALAHWWILRDDPGMASSNTFFESTGHVAALYQNELYETTTGRSAPLRLQHFGVTFGCRYVVIYVEPKIDSARLTTNTARTALLLDNEPVPWSDWAAQFRKAMPREIRAFVDKRAARSVASDHAKAIRDRLRGIMDLFRISWYRPSPAGPCRVDQEQLLPGVASTQEGKPGDRSNAGTGNAAKPVTNIYAVFEKKDGTPAQKAHPDLWPKVDWISIEDGTREPGTIEDRAATYLADQNKLLINGDFLAFKDMEAFLDRQFQNRSVPRALIVDTVHSWFEQALVETILGVRSLRQSREWTAGDIEVALSVESLTTSVMQRYHVYNAAKKELAAKLANRKN